MIARVRPYILLFIGLSVIYHANFRPIDSSDTLPAALIPFALVLDHNITLDRFGPWLAAHVSYTPSVIHYGNGHYFSAYPIGAPLLVSPLYTPAIFSARQWDPAALVTLARIAEKIAASAVTA